MSLTAHCLLVEDKNKHKYFMEIQVISVCFGLSVATDDLYQNNDERMVVLINRRLCL